MIATAEIRQYVRLTLKQHGLHDVEAVFGHCNDLWLGLACCDKNVILINQNALSCFTVFREVILHEVAHFLDYRERGNKGWRDEEESHGEGFKKWCKHLGIKARTHIPA